MTNQTTEKNLSVEELEEKAKKDAAELRQREIELIKVWGITYRLPDPFLQRDMQKYQTRLNKLGKGKETATSVYKGLIIKVALELGWVSGKKLEDVEGMLVGEVTLLSNIIFQDIIEAGRIPNE